jgi:small subunit ribosomal protein S7
MTEAIKIFDRWDSAGITVKDPGLVRYLSVKPILVPKTGARYAGLRFHKSKINIVERLINRLMIPGHKGKKHKFSSGHVTGKGQSAYNLVLEAFDLIEKRVKKNPVEVFVRAVENAAPREELITIEYGGARYPKAVECAPQRRVDVVLKMMTQGTFQKSIKSKKSAPSALADEIVAAFQLSPNSNAISKKLELERQADASR